MCVKLTRCRKRERAAERQQREGDGSTFASLDVFARSRFLELLKAFKFFFKKWSRCLICTKNIKFLHAA